MVPCPGSVPCRGHPRKQDLKLIIYPIPDFSLKPRQLLAKLKPSGGVICESCTILLGFPQLIPGTQQDFGTGTGCRDINLILPLAFYVGRGVGSNEYPKLKRLQPDCEINRAINPPSVIIQQLLIIYKQTSARTVL